MENLPRRGPALLVCQPTSSLDPFLIAACTPRFIRFLMDPHASETSEFHWLAKRMGAIPVSSQLTESLRLAQNLTREGDMVCILGEDAMTENLPHLRPVIAGMPGGLSVPIIPVRIDGACGSALSPAQERSFGNRPRPFRSRVTVSFGPQIG